MFIDISKAGLSEDSESSINLSTFTRYPTIGSESISTGASTIFNVPNMKLVTLPTYYGGSVSSNNFTLILMVQTF